MAKAFGEDEAVTLLDTNLKQEKEALREVEKIATRLSNESVHRIGDEVGQLLAPGSRATVRWAALAAG